VYTYNRFRFDDGSRFDDNTLPMIPEHFGNFEVLYEHPLGFYLGLNVTAADNVFVDFANTVEAKSYAILGARIGYKSRRGLSAFVEIQNLTDEAYTNRIDPIADAGGQDVQRFLPGLTRSVFVGVEWRWR
ncbi:MAG: TonB-dependent receptor domain-containing protein, partial [Candidatus Binatia bacterium]